jgi:hypothetical protein
MGEILVEVRPTGAHGDLSATGVAEKLMSRIGELGDSIAEVSEGLQARLAKALAERTSDWDMDTVEVKFSLDLEAEAGVVVSRAAAKAGFEVTLSWSRQTQ